MLNVLKCIVLDLILRVSSTLKRDSLKIEFRAGQRILCQHGNVLRTMVIVKFKL
ncbi:hypothetical protein BCR32DRAFT_287714 [Anaeromyces robustus]|uniref:Uncharacterized protein n=1 Tax=Anaeromyces robustus TaxID=1754192 RepID=A0A1Y1VQB8_9FUNG|nr:hypothetical protein BCR32DRAFT_287714 [Anaeromyces robustus]|eukprot:ORX63501.1 hypothetical protein BCR32DRAFT_287714 [Anaeromyces robustus]